MAPKKEPDPKDNEPPPVDETQVPVRFYATCDNFEQVDGGTVTFAAFGAEVASLPAALPEAEGEGESPPFAGFRFAGGEEPAEFGQLVTSYKKPTPPKTGIPDEFLHMIVSKRGEVSVTFQAGGGDVYGPGTFRLLQLLQGTTLNEAVTLTRAINAEEKAAYEAEVAKATEEEQEVPPLPENLVEKSIKIDVRAECDNQFAPPEDYDDWNVLHLKMSAVGSLAQSLMPDLTELPSGPVDGFAYKFKINALGAEWEASKLIKPDLPEEEADDSEVQRRPSKEELAPTMTLAEFKLGMKRLQYNGTAADIEETFRYLDQGKDGVVSKSRFCELQHQGGPASVKKLLQFRKELMEKFGDLDAAFEALDTNKMGVLEGHEWSATLIALGMEYDPVTANQIFQALDPGMNGTIDKHEIKTLHLYHALSRLTAVEKFKSWMLTKFKTIKKAYQVFDENNSGQLSLIEFQNEMDKYKSPIEENTVDTLFHVMDLDYDGLLIKEEFMRAEFLTKDGFLKELTSFKKCFVKEYGTDVSAIYKAWKKKFGRHQKHIDHGIVMKSFLKVVEKMKWTPSNPKFDPRYIFTFLDEDFTGFLGESEFRVLMGFNEAAGSNAIKKVRNFLLLQGDMSTAWRFLKEDMGDEFFDLSLKKKARVEFDLAEQSFYIGRRSMMHLLETHREQYGVWIHVALEPKDPAAADIEEKNKIALDHHARFFVPWPNSFVEIKTGGNLSGFAQFSTLRLHRLITSARNPKKKLTGGGDGESSSDSEQEPVGAGADGEEGEDAVKVVSGYEVPRTFCQYGFRLENPLEELGPRNIPKFDVNQIPPPPEEAPQKTPEERYSDVVRDCVGLISERIKSSPLAVADPSAIGQLGSRTLPDAQSLEKLLHCLYDNEEGQTEEERKPVFTKVCEKLSVAAKEVVDSEKLKNADRVPNVRGLCGTDRDKFYSDLYSDLLGQAYATLEQVVQEHEAARAKQYWHFRALPDGGEMAQRLQDDTLKRLADEATMTDNYERAAELHERRLLQPINKYESEPYFEYAKFVCRFKFDVGGGEYYQKALQLLLQGISVVEGLDYAKREHIEMLALLLVRIGKYNDALALFTRDSSAWGESKKLVDKQTSFFLALTYLKKSQSQEEDEALKKHDYAMFRKYLALARRPPYTFKGHGFFDVRVTFAPLLDMLEDLRKKDMEARGESVDETGLGAKVSKYAESESEDSVDSDIDEQDLADMRAEKEEEAGSEDEFGFIRPRQMHPSPLPGDLSALAAIYKTLDFGLPQLTLMLLDGDFLRPRTKESERALLCRSLALYFQKDYKDCLEVLQAVRVVSNDRCQDMRTLEGKCYRALGLNAEAAARDAEAAGLNAASRSEAEEYRSEAARLNDEASKLNAQAIVAFTKATQFIKPCQDPDVFVSLGSVYLEKEDWPKAKQYFERAVELSPSAASWYGSAVAAYRLEMYESAYMAFGEANLLDTERTVIWAFLCACSLRLRKPTVALQAARYVLIEGDSEGGEFDKKFGREAAWPTTWKDLFHDIAEGFLEVQQPKPAAKAAHLARVLEGDHPEAYVFLAKAAHLDGDPARAVGELEVAIGLAYDKEAKYDYQEIGGMIAAASHDVHLHKRIGNAVEAAENRFQEMRDRADSEPETPPGDPNETRGQDD